MWRRKTTSRTVWKCWYKIWVCCVKFARSTSTSNGMRAEREKSEKIWFSFHDYLWWCSSEAVSRAEKSASFDNMNENEELPHAGGEQQYVCAMSIKDKWMQSMAWIAKIATQCKQFATQCNRFKMIMATQPVERKRMKGKTHLGRIIKSFCVRRNEVISHLKASRVWCWFFLP